ncbi:MAG: zinc-dependent alcohol dehydrogenase family protein [Gammaproteobacteria bacterium]|nr:zinc-dependent alcohol dehydrogenase family protein [Gammaproteobacteria bacterium]
MKAVVMTGPGAPEVLQLTDLPEPEITDPGQVKVRLHAAGINPIDTKLRSRGVFFDNAYPAVLGCDGAGEIVEVGNAVTDFAPGDRVWFCHGGLGREQGNYAEFTVIPADEVAAMPESLDYVQAAAAPLVLITAWEGLYERARIKAGQDVLIHAGAGGVGHVAIQLAGLRGVRVITTVGSEEKAELVRGLGADEVILYREQDLVEAVNTLTDGRGADVVFDTVGGDVFRQSIGATAHYGDLVTLLDPGSDVDWKEARNRNLRIGFELMLTPMLRDLPRARSNHLDILNACASLFDAGQLDIHVSEVLSLDQAALAHRQIEAGHTTGKRVLSIVA